MSAFKNFSKFTKTAVLTYLVTLLGFVATSFLFTQGHMDIPLGILLGGTIFGSLSLVSHFLDKKDELDQTSRYSIIIIIVRFVILIASIVVIALMYYKFDLKIFNLFSFIGIYTVSIIIMVIVYLTNKE